MVVPDVSVSPGFPAWTSVFFVMLILVMAILPLVSRGWWTKWYPAVTLLLAVPCALVVGAQQPVALIMAAEEYASFIILIAALYIVSGGIDVETPARGRPGSNALFLLVGAILANVLGTTGASVVLIRPLLRANAWRQRKVHICVFFIFLVSNAGGLLTPLGDPPLFLGYLQGVPFFWTLTLFPLWCVTVGVLIGVFYVLDWVFVRKEAAEARLTTVRFELHGAANVLLLFGIVASLFLPEIPRMIAMIVAALVSMRTTSPLIRKRNDFTYHPIIEVAVLFAGIFVTMIPLQAMVHDVGVAQKVTSPSLYFWLAGGLSSFLDNAPTYLVFFEAAKGATAAVSGLVAGVPVPILEAVAAGCVLMGANTYIGNGPNLMVKAICEDEGVKMPSFLGYMIWSGNVLIPVYALITWLFFVR